MKRICRELDDMEDALLVEPVSTDEDSEENDEVPHGNRCVSDRIPHAGLIYAVISGFTFSIGSVLIKLLHEMDPILASFWAVIILFCSSITYIILKKQHPYPKGYRLLLSVRSVFGAINLISNFIAYRYLPLGDASVILFSTPIFVPILGWFLLNEECSVFYVVVCLLATIGVNCIARPTFLFGNEVHQPNTVGLISAFVGVTTKSVAYLLLRQLKDVHHAVASFHYSLVILASTSAISLVMGTFDVPRNGKDLYLCLGLMLSQYMTQTLIVKSLELEKAGIVSIGRLSDVVFAFVWQVLIFHDPPYFLSIIGAFLVTLSIVMLGVRKVFKESSENHYLECIFCF